MVGKVKMMQGNKFDNVNIYHGCVQFFFNIKYNMTSAINISCAL
jgi:hypothetical protein